MQQKLEHKIRTNIQLAARYAQMNMVKVNSSKSPLTIPKAKPNLRRRERHLLRIGIQQPPKIHK
jgi:predicted nuclease with RNAse H fold